MSVFSSMWGWGRRELSSVWGQLEDRTSQPWPCKCWRRTASTILIFARFEEVTIDRGPQRCLKGGAHHGEHKHGAPAYNMGLQTEPPWRSRSNTCYWTQGNMPLLLNPSQGGSTHFIYLGGMEGWVGLVVRCTLRWFTWPAACSYPKHPSSNRDRRKATSLIGANVTTTPSCQPFFRYWLCHRSSIFGFRCI